MNTEKLFKTEIEKAVLSALIYDNTIFFEYEFDASYFTGLNAHIFAAISKIIKGGGEATSVTLAESLRGVVSAVFISEVSDALPPGNIGYCVEELAEANKLRILYKTLSGAANLCLEGKPTSEVISQTKDVFWRSERTKAAKLCGILPEVVSDIELLSEGRKMPGIKTGINSIDRLTGGFSAGLIIIAGRPGMGKTSLAMNIARNFAMYSHAGLVFSLEMSKKDLTTRMLCDVGSFDGDLFFRGQVAREKNKAAFFDRLQSVASKVSSLPIYIDETSDITVDQIYTRAKKAKVVDGVEWIVVDYLGLIKGWNQRGQEPKAEITRMLKVMSGELDLPVVVLSQMNRSIDQRGDKQPLLSDLRDAGSIEQDADIVMFPIPDTDSIYQDDTPAKVYVAKNRKGPTGFATDLKFEGRYFRYSNRGGYHA